MAAAASDLVLRPVDPMGEQALAWRRCAGLVFKDAVPTTPEVVAWRRPVWQGQRLSGMWDGPEVVGTFRSWDTGLAVPGGRLPGVDAISSVTVRPTHRRRGILTTMMRADLQAAVDRGAPAAVLIASEAAIYGRFGFGPATTTATWSVDARAARVRPDAPTGGRLRFVDADEFAATAPAVYEASRAPGSMDLDAHWWRNTAGLDPMPGGPARHGVMLLHEDAHGRADAALRYRPQETWQDRTCRTVVHVEVLVADTPAGYADLVRYLTELDVVADLRLEERPLDEVLPQLLTNSRAARVTSTCDFLWARLLDVPAALTARRYAAPADLTIEVTDPHGWAAGVFRLEAAPSGASCRRTSGEPDVVLPVDVLSSVWLGGGDLLGAGLAGRAGERSPGALDRLATALRTPRQPWVWAWF